MCYLGVRNIWYSTKSVFVLSQKTFCLPQPIWKECFLNKRWKGNGRNHPHSFWNCFRGKVQVHCALSIFIISTFDAHTYLNCVSAYNPASEFMYFISYHNLNEKGIFLLLKFINSTTDLFYNLIYLSHSFLLSSL